MHFSDSTLALLSGDLLDFPNDEKMIEGSLFEDLDTDICGDFFDNIDDLLDFPNDDIEPGVAGGFNQGLDAILPAVAKDAILPAVAKDALEVQELAFSSGQGSSLCTEDDLAAGLSVPCEDLDQLEWLSTFVEDSFSAGNIPLVEDQHNEQQCRVTSPVSVLENNSSTYKFVANEQQFRSTSPVSVLENNSSTHKFVPLGPDTVVPGRARTKRQRPRLTFVTSPRIPVPLISSTSSSDTNTVPTQPIATLTASEIPPQLDDFAESPSPEMITKKKKNKLAHSSLQTLSLNCPAEIQPVHKCLHCGIQKTPQWRGGPMGPKTLCNACGVRYKSGRLYPEYRPAASPTFVAALHSNSHKKVIEMRTKTGRKEPAPKPQFVRKSSSSDSNPLLLEYKI